MTSSYDFHVCLDHLSTLRRSLADLETTLATAHAHTWPNIDPRLHTGPAAWRTTKGDSASYVYGLLDEADPLGDTHADVVRHLQDWYHRIHGMIAAMTTYAERTRETYSAADEATAVAAMRAGAGEAAVAGAAWSGSGAGAGAGGAASGTAAGGAASGAGAGTAAP